MAMNELTGKRRPRSPGYPGLDLESAIERAFDLYRVAPKHPVPMTVAAEEWGFSAKSSTTKIAAAALKRFGLVRDVGNGEMRQLELTESARELAFLKEERENPRWRELVRNAALAPKIHRQVLDHFGGSLPDERVVLRYLLFELGFADEATAKDFLRRFTATLNFAGVSSLSDAVGALADSEGDDGHLGGARGGSALEDGGDQWRAPISGSAERGTRPVPPTPSVYDHFRADRTSVQIPYSHGEWANLQAGFPLTEAQWVAMMAMLEAMKPGLVAEDGD